MRIKIIYDNNARPGLKTGWGFSCLIENGTKVLFDTGADSETLLYNMKQMGIDPKGIDIVVISHSHDDHDGGLKGFLEANGNRAKVYLPTAFQEPTKICEGVYSTGQLRRFLGMKEQSLVVMTKKGKILITGCAHPGLGKIIDSARHLGEVYGVIGGFHGFSDIEKLDGFRLIAPCHCTQHHLEIKQRFIKQFREIMAGDIIE